ncbi:MAG: TadE/TadG family type IV pilus assembly protein [Vicinamibacterales bacterium]
MDVASDIDAGFRRCATPDERGSVVLEMAVVSPLLLLMVFGLLQFGVIMNSNITLNDAVRVGSRTLATMRGNADPCTATANKMRAAAIGLAVANLSITITVNNTAYGPATIPSCAGAGATMVPGNDATARATYPCSAVILGIDYIPSCTLSAQTSTRVE